MIQKRALLFDKTLLQATLAAFITFIILGVILVKQEYFLFRETISPNVFVHLASSLLHRRLDIDPTCLPDVNPACPQLDLSVFHNKFYAMWAPLPAFLLLPFVYIHGINIGDRWINVLLVSISAAFGWLIIDLIGHRAGWKISTWYKVLITLFLTCGTSFLVLSLAGSHYFMAQVTAATMMLISLYFLFAAHNNSCCFFIAGLFWGFAILSRMHLILAAPIFLYVAFFGMTNKFNIVALKQNLWQKTKNILYLSCPIVFVVLLMAWYNWVRFGTITECGISYHKMHPRFEYDFLHYGYISPHYFWTNVYYTLIRVPFFPPLFGFREPTLNASWAEGYSIFFQSPPLLYALNSLRSIKKDNFIQALWLSILPISTIILWLMGTGWVQFGARYLFDLFPLLFPLTIIGSRGKVTPLLVILVICSVAINIFGSFLFSIGPFKY